MNGIREYIESVDMCEEYKARILGARTKREVFDIIVDINGLGYMCGTDESNKHFVVPYEDIVEKFGKFINGGYIAYNNGYTSKLYCCYCDTEPIVADTTLVGIMGCGDVSVVVPSNSISRLFVDRNSNVKVDVSEGSICECHFTGDTVKWQGKGKFIARRYGE